jgi:hypothetical protein
MKELETCIGTLHLPGLAFQFPLKKNASVTLAQANSIRDAALASLPAALEKVPLARHQAMYAAFQQVLSEKVDAHWWIQHDSVHEAIQDINALVGIAFRKLNRK